MASGKITESLQQLAIFEGLKPGQLTELARHTERVKFAAGDIITQAGQPGSDAYLLVSGLADRVPAPDAAEPVEVVEPGSLIGQLAMLIEHSYGSTVIARERVLCLKITRAGLHAQMLADPSLTEHLQRHITSRLVALADQLRTIDSYLRPPPARVGERDFAAVSQAHVGPRRLTMQPQATARQ